MKRRSPNMVPQRYRPGPPAGPRAVLFALKLALREKRMAIVLIAFILLAAVAEGGAIVFIKEYLESLVTAGSTVAVWLGAATLLGIWVVRTGANLATKIWRFNLARAVELHARVEVLSHLMRLSVGFLENHSRAELIQRVNNDTTALREALTSLSSALSASAQVVALTVVAFLMDPVLALLGLLALPLGIPVLVFVGRKLVEEAKKQREAGVKLVDLLVELMNGIRTIKAYNGEERERAFHQEACEEIYEFSGRRNAWQVSAVAVPEMALGVGLVAIVVVGGMRLVDGAMEWPALLGFLLAVVGLRGPFSTLIQSQAKIQAKIPYAERFFELLETEPTVKDPDDPQEPPEGAPSIELRDVTYRAGESVILEDVSVRIAAGETVGLVGPTGAGKTSFLNLVARFLDPTEGAVLYDGLDLREMRQEDVARRLALVAQDAFLFATDVGTNIGYARPEAGMGEIRKVARAAGILEEIDEMPHGFETRVGLGGQPVSGGQAQRINLARALLKDAPILLLDEATNALDSETEARVQSAIDRYLGERRRTTLLVAHRLSTLRKVDRILVLEKGRVSGFGTHDALLDDCEVYRRLVEKQKLGVVSDRPVPPPAGVGR